MKTRVKITAYAIFAVGLTINAQDGGQLFKQKCGVCHSVGKGKVVGPDLKGVHTKYKEDWLLKWVKSSQALVKKKDPAAVKLFEENNKLVMPDQMIADNEIKAILSFVKDESEKPEAIAEVPKDKINAPAPVENAPKADDYRSRPNNPVPWKAATYMLIAFCGLLTVVIIAMANVIRGMAKAVKFDSVEHTQ